MKDEKKGKESHMCVYVIHVNFFFIKIHYYTRSSLFFSSSSIVTILLSSYLIITPSTLIAALEDTHGDVCQPLATVVVPTP